MSPRPHRSSPRKIMSDTCTSCGAAIIYTGASTGADTPTLCPGCAGERRLVDAGRQTAAQILLLMVEIDRIRTGRIVRGERKSEERCQQAINALAQVFTRIAPPPATS